MALGLSGSKSATKGTETASNTQPTAVITQTTTNQSSPTPTPTAVPKTPQQLLEDSLVSVSNKSIGGSEFSYKGIKIEKADSDRPKGSSLITVTININSFLTKNTLTKSTGELSSSIMQAVFNATALSPYDLFIYYYGDTKDTFGNTNNSDIMNFSIDKITYDKINWAGFDKDNLCSFLSQYNQDHLSDKSLNANCLVLANIQ